MRWRATKTESRIAAKNASKIRAAIRDSINAKAIYESYLITQPHTSGKASQDRARARAWAILNVRLDNTALYAALRKLYADGSILGQTATMEMLRVGAKQNRKSLEKVSVYVNWDTWKPGNRAAAALVRPKGALKAMLERMNTRIKGIDDETYNLLGTALADAVELGLSGESASKLIRNHVGSASRALTIAITEQARIISAERTSVMRERGIKEVTWEVSNPCDTCAENEGEIRVLGEEFPTGDTQPPVHPNCQCALAPVIPDDYDELFDWYERQEFGVELPTVESDFDLVSVSDLETY